MNILMIGHSRSGKTSYMAGLYHQFGDNADGFGLWMTSSPQKANLIQLGKNLTKGVYPDGTDIASVYNFWLQYDDKLLIPFDWYDYRGGVISESSAHSPDAQKLLEQIKTADALIVFLDGAKIIKEVDDDLEDEYDILKWVIQKALSIRAEKDIYFPVSFVITKGDLYSSYGPLINSPGLEYFLPLIESISNSSTAAGMVSVVEIARDDISNVFAPLIFSLYYGMPHYIRERVRVINQEIEHYNSLAPGILDSAVSWLFDMKSDATLAKESLEKLQEERNQLEMLENLADVMKQILDHLREKKLILSF